MNKLLALILFLAGSSGAPADEGGYDNLGPLEFLLGSCWQGAFPDGKSVDTHCFESVFGGKFIRDTHLVRGPGPDYRGETLFYWDVEEASVRYLYLNSIGGVSSGQMFVGETGNLLFPESYTADDGSKIEIRSVMTALDKDTYFTISEMQNGEGWDEAWRIKFSRLGIPKEEALK